MTDTPAHVHTCVPQGPLTRRETEYLAATRNKAGLVVPVYHRMDDASFRRGFVEHVNSAVTALVARGLLHPQFWPETDRKRFYFLTAAGVDARKEVLS